MLFPKYNLFFYSFLYVICIAPFRKWGGNVFTRPVSLFVMLYFFPMFLFFDIFVSCLTFVETNTLLLCCGESQTPRGIVFPEVWRLPVSFCFFPSFPFVSVFGFPFCFFILFYFYFLFLFFWFMQYCKAISKYNLSQPVCLQHSFTVSSPSPLYHLFFFLASFLFFLKNFPLSLTLSSNLSHCTHTHVWLCSLIERVNPFIVLNR